MPPAHRRLLGVALFICLALAFAVVGVNLRSHHSPAEVQSPTANGRPPTETSICGQSLLKSPYHYNGAAGAYSNGTAGLPTFGTADSDFPKDTAGYVLPAGTRYYASYQLNPNTVYYLLPGTHIGAFQANINDAFVGGFSNGVPTVLSGDYSGYNWAIDSNSTNGNQPGVTIEYLTIEKYLPNVDAGAINQETNTNWTIQYNTITLNVPGAGVMAGANNVIKDNCMTQNGQYGFQSTDVNTFGTDSLTGGPYNVTIEDNEISYNDTCDLEGLAAIASESYDPVPARYRNTNCRGTQGDGNYGGFKLWATNGVTIKKNYIHNNYGPGAWADTDNANTTYTANTFTDNDGPAIVEEISYNFSITGNYMAGNDIAAGLSNPDFPQPAIYIASSGSDTQFGGVPACAEATCAHQASYTRQSVISGNILVNNGGGVFLWQDSNRYCSDQSDYFCTLVNGGSSGPFTKSACAANLPTAAVNTASNVGQGTGSPGEDWRDGCIWKTENVSVSVNTIDFNPADIKDCNQAMWPDCGANGIFSEYGSPPNKEPGWVIPTQLTFYQHNTWSDNVYNGPSNFWAWNQGNGDNPVSWADWTERASLGDKCGSPDNKQSGYCAGPFGQDEGSIYNSSPPSTLPSPTGKRN